MMDVLPVELRMQVLSFIDVKDYYSVAVSCRDFHGILNQSYFKEIWKFSDLMCELKNQKHDTTFNMHMKVAAKYNRRDLVESFISKGAFWFEGGLRGAAKGGHLTLVKFFIEKGVKDLREGLAGAAKAGHLTLVKFFIEEGARWLEWDGGMFYAAKAGHLSLVKFFIEKEIFYFHGGDEGLRGAALGGHLSLVKFLIENGSDDWNSGMIGAAEGGHLSLVQFFIEKGANDWNSGLYHAAAGGHLFLMEFFISKVKDLTVRELEFVSYCTKPPHCEKVCDFLRSKEVEIFGQI